MYCIRQVWSKVARKMGHVRKIGNHGLSWAVWVLMGDVTVQSDVWLTNVRIVVVELSFCRISKNNHATLFDSCPMGRPK